MLNTVKVVHIGSGEVIDAIVTDWGQVWEPEHLKKDGRIPLRISCDGYMISENNCELYYFAPYIPEREERAQGIRSYIAGLRAQVQQAEQGLLALYKVKREG